MAPSIDVFLQCHQGNVKVVKKRGTITRDNSQNLYTAFVVYFSQCTSIVLPLSALHRRWHLLLISVASITVIVLMLTLFLKVTLSSILSQDMHSPCKREFDRLLHAFKQFVYSSIWFSWLSTDLWASPQIKMDSTTDRFTKTLTPTGNHLVFL